jgi:hypothetical protein
MTSQNFQNEKPETTRTVQGRSSRSSQEVLEMRLHPLQMEKTKVAKSPAYTSPFSSKLAEKEFQSFVGIAGI